MISTMSIHIDDFHNLLHNVLHYMRFYTYIVTYQAIHTVITFLRHVHYHQYI